MYFTPGKTSEKRMKSFSSDFPKIPLNSAEFPEFQGKFVGNWGKIGELCFLNGETEFPGGKIISPHIREKGVKWGQTVSQNFQSGEFVWNRWGKWKGKEREFRSHDQFQLHSTVFSVYSLGILCVFSEYSLGILQVFSKYSPGFLQVFSGYFLCIFWVFSGYSPDSLRVFSGYSLHILWLLSAYSPGIVSKLLFSWNCPNDIWPFFLFIYQPVQVIIIHYKSRSATVSWGLYIVDGRLQRLIQA